MILELSQLAFRVCKEDFFFYLFRVPYLDICLDSFLFHCLLDSRVQHCIICLFPSDCTLSTALVFRFISFFFLH